MIKIDYGKQLMMSRQKFGVSQSELALHLNTSHQNVSRWEANKAMPSIEICVKIADYYGISLDELVGRK